MMHNHKNSKGLLEGMSKEAQSKLLVTVEGHAGQSVLQSTSELMQVQTSALQAYRRDPTNKATTSSSDQSMSQYVSGDVADAVDSMLPKLLDAVEKQPRFVQFEADGDAEEAMAQSLAVESVIRDQQLESHKIIHDWAKSGLLYKIGIVYIQRFQAPMQPFHMKHITILELLELAEQAKDPEKLKINPKIEQLDADPDAYPMGKKYNISGMRMPKPKILIDSLPPEALLLPPYSKTLDQGTILGSPYVGIKQAVSLGQLAGMYPDRSKEILGWAENPNAAALGSDSDMLFSDERLTARFNDEIVGEAGGLHAEGSNQRTITHYNEWIRHDLDGDGYMELINIQRANKKLMGIYVVTNNPLAWWTPFPIPNKAIGESLVDKVMQFQEVNTQLARAGLDATAFAINPQIGVDMSRISAGNIETADTLDDLLAGFKSGAGKIIRTVGNPKEVLTTFTPDATAADTAFKVMSLFKDERLERSGEMSQSKDGSAQTNRTAAGMAMVLQPGARFAGYIATNYAEGLRIMAVKIRNLLRESGDIVRVRGEDKLFAEYNPANWADLDCQVNVAGAMMNHQEKMTFLSMLIDRSYEFMGSYGLDNPLVGVKNVRRMLIEMVASMGFRDPDQFFNHISDEQIEELMEAQAQNDPEAQKMEAEQQAREQEMAMQQQAREQEMAMKQQEQQTAVSLRAYEMEMKAQMERAEMEFKQRMAVAEMQMKYDLQRLDGVSKWRGEKERTAIEASMETRQQDLEAWLKQRQQDLEAMLKARQIDKDSKVKQMSISGVKPGGKVG